MRGTNEVMMKAIKKEGDLFFFYEEDKQYPEYGFKMEICREKLPLEMVAYLEKINNTFVWEIM